MFVDTPMAREWSSWACLWPESGTGRQPSIQNNIILNSLHILYIPIFMFCLFPFIITNLIFKGFDRIVDEDPPKTPSWYQEPLAHPSTHQGGYVSGHRRNRVESLPRENHLCVGLVTDNGQLVSAGN